jgi:TIR domain
MADQPTAGRNVVFISKATPGDDEFVLWLAPRLEAAGYEVFADILRLDPGARWRKELTSTLQARAIKLLLCCRDATLERDGVQEEIGIAEDLAKELNDPKFVIPLRLAKFKKLFGIGELQGVDFTKSWADGLAKLLATLAKQNVPRDTSAIRINSNWELYLRRNAVAVKREPEPLTSNWLRILEMPDAIRYFEPTGAVDQPAMYRAARDHIYPAEPYERGFFSFAGLEEVNQDLARVGRFALAHEVDTLTFLREGDVHRHLRAREATNMVQSMCRKAWETYCQELGLLRFAYSKDPAFHAADNHARLGQKIAWGTQGEKRSSMLRNIAKGHVWQFGVTGIPSFWPYPHFRLKSRVLFSSLSGEKAGPVIDDKDKQHRLRRTVCKGWRNKQWHGRLRAFLEVLAGDAPYIGLMLGSEVRLKLDSVPVFFTSPVTTELPNEVADEQDEQDESTITTPIKDDEDETP